MTPDALDATPTTTSPAPAGLKAKANDVLMKAYLKAPPKAQTALLNGFLKAQPLVARAKPFAKPAGVALGGLVVLRKVRRRR